MLKCPDWNVSLFGYIGGAHTDEALTYYLGNEGSERIHGGQVDIAPRAVIHGGVNKGDKTAIFIPIHSGPDIGYEEVEQYRLQALALASFEPAVFPDRSIRLDSSVLPPTGLAGDRLSSVERS